MDFFSLLAQPSRARAFNPSRPLSHEILTKLTWAAEQTPSDGVRRWHLEVVRTESGVQRLTQPTLGGRRLAAGPAAMLVFCAAAPAGGPDGGDRDATAAAAAAAAVTRLAVMALGLAVDWVPVSDPHGVAAALDLKPIFTPVVVLGVGYER